jgi:hypothetical protein
MQHRPQLTTKCVATCFPPSKTPYGCFNRPSPECCPIAVPCRCVYYLSALTALPLRAPWRFSFFQVKVVMRCKATAFHFTFPGTLWRAEQPQAGRQAAEITSLGRHACCPDHYTTKELHGISKRRGRPVGFIALHRPLHCSASQHQPGGQLICLPPMMCKCRW